MLAAAMMAQAAAGKDKKSDDGSQSKSDDGDDEPLAPPGNSGSGGADKKKTDDAAAASKTSVAKKEEAADESFSQEETKASEDIDVEALKSMKISELKAELAAYGISTATFIEKGEYVNALADARASGRPKARVAQTSPAPSSGKKAESKDGKDSDDGDDESSSGVYIDEETFRAWAAAQEAHEAKASEIAAKACARCCEQVFWAMMLALFVAKLAGEDVGGDPTGQKSYSSFWILFPFLLMAAIFLCCCCCSIYCASGMEGMEENLRQSMAKKPNDTGGQSGNAEEPTAPAAAPAASDEESPSAPFIPVPPPPPAAADELSDQDENQAKVAEMMLAEAVKASIENAEPQNASDSDGLD
jgi:hypothetical protein